MSQQSLQGANPRQPFGMHHIYDTIRKRNALLLEVQACSRALSGSGWGFRVMGFATELLQVRAGVLGS